jgi:eukaryotic-like serine/threonine-protein kinase
MQGRPSQLAAGVREGDVIAGKYRVEKILGAGGMGVVVAARHVQLDEKVALKFLLPEALGDEQAVARFVREARAAVKIKSEHVARVTDVGTLENGAPYIVMEYLDGGDLAAWLKQRGALPVEQAVEFVLQACVAVAEAHALGIVHRDLKPANLFCVRRADGQLSIKVLDFGISKRIDVIRTGAEMGMTRTGALMGTPLYMSPEQMRSSKDVQQGTDIWALGIILFELMAGRPAFVAESVTELAIKVASEPAPPIRNFRPEVPGGLEAVLLRCLEKHARRRYRNVGELALGLLPFAPKRAAASVERISGIIHASGLSASALAAPPSSDDDGTPRSVGTLPAVGRTTIGPTRGRSAVLWAGAGVVLAGLASTAVLVWYKSGPTPHDEPQPATTLRAAAAIASERIETSEPPKPVEVIPAVPIASTEATATSVTHVAAPSKPWKNTKTPPAPAAPAIPSPTPSCSVVTDYDTEGQPHFRKVCQ